MTEKTPIRTEIRDLRQAQEQTSTVLSERLVKVEELVNKQELRNDRQESRNQNTLYAVLVAFIFIVITVAVEVLLSKDHDDTNYRDMNSEIRKVDDHATEIQRELDILKARNAYLK